MDYMEQLIIDLIEKVIAEADKHGDDRDEVIEYVAYIFEALSDSTTFNQYKR